MWIKTDFFTTMFILLGIGRPFGVKATENNIRYHKGSVLDAEENKEVEYKSVSSAHPSILPWKIMEKAKSSSAPA